MMKVITLLLALAIPQPTLGFVLNPSVDQLARLVGSRSWQLGAKSREANAVDDTLEPQAWSSGYSLKVDLEEAIKDATMLALQGLPRRGRRIDISFVFVSSLYDGQSSPSIVVPAILEAASSYGEGLQHLIGCTTGGLVSSSINDHFGLTVATTENGAVSACVGIEPEGVPGVSVMLGVLPGVNLKTWHVTSDDVPDDVGRLPSDEWKRAVGLTGFLGESNMSGKPIFCVIPAPSFQKELDDLLSGISYNFPSSMTFGGIASTVSSLSRARLFRYECSEPQAISTFADGCVGIAMEGDIEAKQLVALGTKPVGGIYRIVTGEESTIKAIVLDEIATQEAQEAEDALAEEELGEEEESPGQDERAMAAAAYAKAAIPKPVLAEANFVMRTLSDDDQAYMRKAILIGIERGGPLGRTPNELARLAEGKGHRFTVYQVASAGMKDGSVTLPLGSVDVRPGTRVRFYVRESEFSKREISALWTGYKKRTLEETLLSSSDTNIISRPFEPAACLLVPTLDRGNRFFGGRTAYESRVVNDFLPTLPCIAGFFANGIVGKLDDEQVGQKDAMIHGSASTYVLFGSVSRRPLYLPSKAAAEEAKAAAKLEEDANDNKDLSDGGTSAFARAVLAVQEGKAPRDSNGELILKRREVHSGRALTVSTVEWSVAERIATPRSTLEGFLWDKELETDRFRERVPLSNLVSQCRTAAADPTKPKPRDWVGPIKRRSKENGRFVIIPECKRSEPTTGSLRKRYDVAKLVKQFVASGVPALAVNCDGVLFGGSLDDLTVARQVSAKAALNMATEEGIEVPPILGSDLILYPYQLYKLYLAGSDAVVLVAGALSSKDLLYLTKIAASLKLQVVISVTSTVQIDSLMKLEKGSIHAVIVSNRELEDFSFDMSGQQALSLLTSASMKALLEHHGADLPVLVEGRVGLIGRDGYVDELKSAGAIGAVCGGALADKELSEQLLNS